MLFMLFVGLRLWLSMSRLGLFGVGQGEVDCLLALVFTVLLGYVVLVQFFRRKGSLLAVTGGYGELMWLMAKTWGQLTVACT